MSAVNLTATSGAQLYTQTTASVTKAASVDTAPAAVTTSTDSVQISQQARQLLAQESALTLQGNGGDRHGGSKRGGRRESVGQGVPFRRHGRDSVAAISIARRCS